MINRFMRLIVLFDLPTETKKDKRNYLTFRRFLLNNGYDMLQFSVYSRLCRDADQAEIHIKRLKNNAPKDGSVRVLMMTNKQYSQAIVLTGRKKPQEKCVNESQLLLF